MLNSTFTLFLYLFFIIIGYRFLSGQKLRWWFLYLAIITTLFTISLYPKKVFFNSEADFDSPADKIRLYVDRDGFLQSQKNAIDKDIEELESFIKVEKKEYPKRKDYFNYDDDFYKNATTSEIQVQKLRDKANYIEDVEFSNMMLHNEQVELKKLQDLRNKFKNKYFSSKKSP